MSREEDAILSQAPQNHRLRLSRSSHKVYTWNPGECICMPCVWSYSFLLGCCGWWYQVLFVTDPLLTHFHLQHAICLVISRIHVFWLWCNAGMCRHHWHTQENGREEWMGVKIGYHFASTLMGNLLIRSLPVIGPITTLPTKEHLTTPNLLLGLPDSITKHNTVLIVYTRLFSFIIKVMLFNRILRWHGNEINL